ncbi:MAG: DUF3667 domain-containing protein [Acidobacteriota bacterium]
MRPSRHDGPDKPAPPRPAPPPATSLFEIVESPTRQLDQDPTPCPSCEAQLAGPFCAQCGESGDFAPVPLRVWLQQTWSSFAGLDAKWLRSLLPLLLRPGFLTEEYLRGRRVLYTKPLKLYVLLSAVSIAAMSSLSTFDVDSWPPGSEESLRSLAAKGPEDAQFIPRFEKRLNVLFPILNLISPFLWCFLLKALYRRRFLETHLVFSLHFFSFFVFFGITFLLAQQLKGTALTLALGAILGATTLYLAVAQRRVYGGSWIGHLIRLPVLAFGTVLCAAVVGISTFFIAIWTL